MVLLPLSWSLWPHNLRSLTHSEVGPHDGEDEDAWRWRCYTPGFIPQDLKVTVEGDLVAITGEHKETSAGQSVEQRFEYRLSIPSEVIKATITCHVDNAGRLVLEGKRKKDERRQNGKHEIPVRHITDDIKSKL
ncbi:small HSP21-like protein [Aphelenchoides avenae]|nr:small HSP21-like protein [Aphelenchus avenae]